MTEFKDIWAVNWKDGMLVSAKHFQDTQVYIDNLGRRLLGSILSEDYGLVLDPLEPKPEISLSWRLEQPSRRVVEAHVTSCRAVAPDGSMITIFPEAESYNVTYSDSKEIPDDRDVRLSVYIEPTDDYTIIGIQNGDEEPPRELFQIPEFKVRLVATTLEPVRALRIGQIRVINGQAQVDNNYVPPCTSMFCHPRLIDLRKQFYQHLSDLQVRSTQCAKYLFQNRTPRGVFNYTDPEATLLMRFSHQFANRLSENIDAYRDDISRKAPRQVVVYFKSFFRSFDVLLGLSGDQSKQRLYALWTTHCNPKFKPAEFEETLDRFLTKRYSQENIRFFLDHINYLLTHLNSFFRALLGKAWTAEAQAPGPRDQRDYDFEVTDMKREDF